MKTIHFVVRVLHSGKYAVGVLSAFLALVSPNAFALWTKAISPFGAVQHVVAGTGVMYAVQSPGSGNAVLYKSVDAGTTWTQVSFGQIIVQSITGVAINPLNPSNVFVTAFDASPQTRKPAVISTADAGLTWTSDTTIWSTYFVDLRGVAVSSTKVYVFDNSNSLYSKGTSATDTFWVPGTSKTQDTITHVAVSSAAGSDTILVATNSGLYMSLNGLSSLQPLQTIGSTLPALGAGTLIRDLVADATTPNVYLSVYSSLNPTAGGLFRGAISGQTVTWTNITGTGSVLAQALSTQGSYIGKIAVDSTALYVGVTARNVQLNVSREQVYYTNDKVSFSGAWQQVSGVGQDVGANGVFETLVNDMVVGTGAQGANVVVAGETGIHSSSVSGTGVPCTTPGGCAGTATGVDMSIQSGIFTPAQVTVGGTTSLAVTVRNNSTTLPASNVAVDITMPSFPVGLVFPATTTVTSVPFGVYTCTGQGTAALKCSRTLGTVFPANSTETITIPSLLVPATVTTGTTLSLTVKVSHTPLSAADTDANQFNNTSQATLTVGAGAGGTPLPGQNVAPVASQPNLTVQLTTPGLPSTGSLGVTDANNEQLTYTVTPAISSYGSQFTVTNGFYSYTRGAAAGTVSETFTVTARDTAGLTATVNITFVPGPGFVPAGATAGGGGAMHPLILLALASMAAIYRRRIVR